MARGYAKLLAYKDEYEVARLYSDGSFEARLREEFEGDFRLEYNLAPPLLAGRDPETGRLHKRAYGAWMLRGFGLLAKLRGLRGTPFDVFGYTRERRLERQLAVDYERTLREVAAGLCTANLDVAVEIAELPREIRGYDSVKLASVERVRARQSELLRSFHSASEASLS